MFSADTTFGVLFLGKEFDLFCVTQNIIVITACKMYAVLLHIAVSYIV